MAAVALKTRRPHACRRLCLRSCPSSLSSRNILLLTRPIDGSPHGQTQEGAEKPCGPLLRRRPHDRRREEASAGSTYDHPDAEGEELWPKPQRRPTERSAARGRKMRGAGGQEKRDEESAGRTYAWADRSPAASPPRHSKLCCEVHVQKAKGRVEAELMYRRGDLKSTYNNWHIKTG